MDTPNSFGVNEDCDGSIPAGTNCESLSLCGPTGNQACTGGTLTCSSTCAYDVSACSYCGDDYCDGRSGGTETASSCAGDCCRDDDPNWCNPDCPAGADPDCDICLSATCGTNGDGCCPGTCNPWDDTDCTCPAGQTHEIYRQPNVGNDWSGSAENIGTGTTCCDAGSECVQGGQCRALGDTMNAAGDVACMASNVPSRFRCGFLNDKQILGGFCCKDGSGFVAASDPHCRCANNAQDGDETGVDCGGADCPACVVCNNNNVKDNGELGVDCGGGGCPACGCDGDDEYCNSGCDPPDPDCDACAGVTACVDTDACCPAGCTPANDAQCTCADVTACTNGDGCCPSGCNPGNDDDCSCPAGSCVSNSQCSTGDACSVGSCRDVDGDGCRECTSRSKCGFWSETECNVDRVTLELWTRTCNTGACGYNIQTIRDCSATGHECVYCNSPPFGMPEVCSQFDPPKGRNSLGFSTGWDAECKCPANSFCSPSEMFCQTCIKCDQDGDGYNRTDEALCTYAVGAGDCVDDPAANPRAEFIYPNAEVNFCGDFDENDCSGDAGYGEVDYDGVSGSTHGDVQCPVEVTAANAPVLVDTVAACGQEVRVSCTVNPLHAGVRSIGAEFVPSGGGSVQPVSFLGWDYGGAGANVYTFGFSVSDLPDGTYTARCFVDDTKSYVVGSGEAFAPTITTVDCWSTVQGYVTEPLGTVLQGVGVAIEGTAFSDTTDAGGFYQFVDVLIGDYDVTAGGLEGYYGAERRDYLVRDDIENLDFVLDPWQCDANCTFGDDRCDYSCLGDSGCSLGLVDPADQAAFMGVCEGALLGSQREFNVSHVANCCIGPLDSSENFETPLTVQSCAEQLVPHTRLVNYNGKIHRLTVVTYRKCE